ncbi:MAG: hypothetical protein IJ740_11120 [Ruminococcus sp.]|nr:hypothetical protein [Ruminococcus sp.]
MLKKMILICSVCLLLTGCGSVADSSSQAADDTSASQQLVTEQAQTGAVVVYMDRGDYGYGKLIDDKALLEKTQQLYESIPEKYEPVEEKDFKKGAYIKLGLSESSQEQKNENGFLVSDEKLYIPDKEDNYVRIDGKLYYTDGGEISELAKAVLDKTQS